MWLILRKHTESIFRVSGEREEEGCFIMQEGRDPLSLITWVIIIVTVSLTVFNTAGALVAHPTSSSPHFLLIKLIKQCLQCKL